MRPKLSQSSNGGVGAGATASSGLVPVPPSPPTQPTRPAPPISQSLTAQASTRETTTINYGPGPSSSSTGIINPVFVSDLVEGNQSGQPPPTKPKPKKQAPSTASHLVGVGVGPAGPVGAVGAVGVVSRPQGRTSSGSQSDASASGGSTVETTASDDNRRTLTTSSLEIGDHGSHHSSHSSHPSSSGHSGASTSVKHRAVSSHQSEPSCDFCYRFHVNNHHARSHRVQQQQQQQQQRIPAPAASRYLYEAPPVQPYAPYPPQWYYLLGADSPQFRKHKHSHYRKDCKVCRQIVRQTFEQYYLGQTQAAAGGSPMAPHRDRVDGGGGSTPDSGSLVPVSLMSEHHSDRLLDSVPTSATGSPLPFVYLPRRRANCGHSCLKYSILFYCSVAVILAICFICYLTKMFGYLETVPGTWDSTVGDGFNGSLSEESFLSTSPPIGGSLANESMLSTVAHELRNAAAAGMTPTTTTAPSATTMPTITAESASSMLEMVRFEMIGIIVCSALMIVFFLGLIGAFLESLLCLRIFGAILSYLFLLTFGAALYIIILLVISHVPAKLILSTISCSAVAITLHAALAIAPFAFADLISQERQDEKNEINSTYFKYPSVRFLPSGAPGGHKRRSSYFSMPFLNSGGGRMWTSRARMAGAGVTAPYPMPPTTTGHHRAGSQATSSARTSPVDGVHAHHALHQQDNLSSEGLIPPSHPSTVRFNDNWI